jgi:hypothetical protein
MHRKYVWSKGQENWVEKNADVLQQIYDNVDKVE